MKKSDPRPKQPRGKTITADDLNPAQTGSTARTAKRKLENRKGSRKSKAAVTIGPGATSTRDVWLDKA